MNDEGEKIRIRINKRKEQRKGREKGLPRLFDRLSKEKEEKGTRYDYPSAPSPPKS